MSGSVRRSCCLLVFLAGVSLVLARTPSAAGPLCSLEGGVCQDMGCEAQGGMCGRVGTIACGCFRPSCVRGPVSACQDAGCRLFDGLCRRATSGGGCVCFFP